MFTGRNIHCTKNIVGTSVNCFLIVYVRSPTRIIDFRKYYYSTLLRINFINQFIRFITFQNNCTQAVFSCSRIFYSFGKAFVYYSHFGRINLMNSLYFFVGIVHILNLIYKPSVAQGIRIEYRSCRTTLKRENKVTGIQHVQYREMNGIYLCHISTCCRKFFKQGSHFTLDMLFYHFLITAQLGGMITTDTLMPVRCIILIKCIAGETYKVQYPII